MIVNFQDSVSLEYTLAKYWSRDEEVQAIREIEEVGAIAITTRFFLGG